MILKIKLFASTLSQNQYLNILRKNKERVGKIVTGFLVAYLAYICAQLLFSVLTHNTQDQLVDISTVKIVKANAEDVGEYVNLFGQFKHKTSPKSYQKIKTTRLNLTLVGVIFKQQQALAMIKNGNSKASIYQKGDNITPRVVLKDIAKNYVIIQRAGRLEKILIKFDYIGTKNQNIDSTNNFSKKQKTTAKISTAQKQRLAHYFKKVSSKPLELLSLMSITPNFTNGKLDGFKINPNKERKLFKDLGFKKNDIAVRINDIILDDFSASLKMPQLFDNTRVFDIYLRRDGRQSIVSIDLTNFY
ncbi:General secretion pathway protein C [uncultured Candidatus Thioglobus sp.]|nr:General secretion pathway protein C [uncultured Candidatus Thioglobus sp.]